MKGLWVFYWANAWGAYHGKNFGVAKDLLEKIDRDSDEHDDEFREDYDVFKEMIKDELERGK